MWASNKNNSASLSQGANKAFLVESVCTRDYIGRSEWNQDVFWSVPEAYVNPDNLRVEGRIEGAKLRCSPLVSVDKRGHCIADKPSVSRLCEKPSTKVSQALCKIARETEFVKEQLSEKLKKKWKNRLPLARFVLKPCWESDSKPRISS